MASVKTPIDEPSIWARAAMAARVLAGQKPSTTYSAGEAPKVTQEGMEGRAFDFPMGYNQNVNPKRDSAITFDQLRALADSYDVLRSVIETRKDQICGLDWTVKPRDEKTKTDPRCDAAIAFLQVPDGENDWQTWLRILIEDLFVVDALTVYPRLTRGGELFALEPIDGATIVRKLDDRGRTPMEGVAYQQVIKGLPVAEYAAKELIYRPRNRRSYKVYGYSPVEQIVMLVNLALRRQVSTMKEYTDGNMPAALIGVPSDWSPKQVLEYNIGWNEMMRSNPDMKGQMRFVPSDLTKNYQAFPKPSIDKAFDEWLARVVCYVFSVSPQAFVTQQNRATAETAQDTAITEGLEPIKRYVKGLMDGIISQFWGVDLVFDWVVKASIKPELQADIDSKLINAKVVTVEEVRAQRGLPPLTPEQKAELNPPAPEPKAPDVVPPKEPEPQKLAKAAKEPETATNPNEAKLAALEPEIAAAVGAALAVQANTIIADLALTGEAIVTAEMLELAAVVDVSLDGVIAKVLPQLEQAAVLGAERAAAMFDVDVTGDAFLDVRDRAKLQAKDRAAEMVGRKWVDGKLVDNPNARWAITQTTREEVNALVSKAVEKGWSYQELAKNLTDDYAFSAARSAMIARTEIGMADGAGTHLSAKVLGATQKKSLLGGNENHGDIDIANAAQGWIEIDAEFSSGHMHPTYHPHCRCTLVYQ